MRPLPKRFSLKPIQRFLLSKLASAVRYVYSFDGVDDRGQLAFRAINPDGDIDIEFETGNTVPPIGSARVIVDQSYTANYNQKEFMLQINYAGQMQVLLGGNYMSSNSNTVVSPNNKYRMTLIGNVLTFFLNGVVRQVINVTRGSFREPSALTKIGCTQLGGVNTFGDFYQGFIKNIKISGSLWPLSDKNLNIQLPNPNALGAELISLDSILWDSGAVIGSVNGNEISYTASDSWGQRGFRFPIKVKPYTAYFVEADIEGYSQNDTVIIILNDRTDSGLPHVNPTTWPYTPSVEYDKSSNYYGAFYGFSISGGKFRGVFYIPGATNLDWYFSLRRVTGQNGLNIKIRNLSVKPLWVDEGSNLWGGRNLSTANAATVSTNVNGTSWTVTRTGSAIPADGARSGDISNLEVGSIYAFSVNSNSPVHLAIYDSGFVLKEQSRSNTLIFRAQAVNKLYVCPAASNTAVTVTNPQLVKIAKLCNPITLFNTNPDRWEDESYLRAFSFNEPRNTQYLPII